MQGVCSVLEAKRQTREQPPRHSFLLCYSLVGRDEWSQLAGEGSYSPCRGKGTGESAGRAQEGRGATHPVRRGQG